MAIDPNAATVQPSGWALGGLGAPSQSTIPLARPQSVLTPEQIAQLRQQALTLQQPPSGGIHHWTQGLAELARAIQGNREADFARQAEEANRQVDISNNMALFPQTPGGAPAPAAGGAPAGAGGGASTGSAAQSPDTTTQTADASAPRGIRNNNPLNIEDGQFARAQPGYAGSDGRFAKFETPEHGVGAADSLLTSYQNNHGLNTVAGIVGRWAPASDNNDTKAYASHVAAQMGIGPNDPIPPEMRPQLIAAMAQHENGRPLVLSATPSPKVAPTGLLAPIQPPAAASAAPAPAPSAPAAPAAPTRLAYAGNPPPGIVPPTAPPASPLSPMISAIAGQPVPPSDFARQSAAMEAAKAGGMPPLPTPGAAIPPADFARQAAAMEAAKGSPTVPPMLASLPAQAGGPATVPPAPVPQTGPTAPIPPPFVPSGGSTPGSIGPTSVNGQPLDYTASLPRPPAASPPANPATVAAIAGRPVPPIAAPATAGGAPIPPPPVQVAQNGLPTSAVPSPAGGPAGLPQPMIAPHPSLDQLRAVIKNPRSSPQMRAVALQQAQALMQPQSMPYGTGTIQFIPGTGQKQYVEGPAKTMDLDMGGIKIPHQLVFDPATGQYSLKNLMAGPSGGAAGQPAAGGSAGGQKFDFSTPEGVAAASEGMAGAKKAAEAAGEANAKRYSALHGGIAGGGDAAADSLHLTQIATGAINNPGFYSGTGSDAILALKKAGVATGLLPQDATTPMEVLNKVMASNILNQVDQLKAQQEAMGQTGGRIFQSQIQLMEKAAQNPENSVAANRYLTALATWSAKRSIKIADMADNYAQDHSGNLDAGFDKTLRHAIAEDPELALPKELQFQGGEEGPAAASPPSAPTAAPQSISTKQQYDALPSGSSYVAPDGSTRTKK